MLFSLLGCSDGYFVDFCPVLTWLKWSQIKKSLGFHLLLQESAKYMVHQLSLHAAHETYPLRLLFSCWTKEVVDAFLEFKTPLHTRAGVLKLGPGDFAVLKRQKTFEVN